jgi:putative MATE family efflux protein
MLSSKLYYQQLVVIAIPITLQNLIQSSLNTVDTIMVGKLGEASIAGVGLANQFFFIFLMLLFGINSGTSIFHSQFHGKEDFASIRKCFGFSVKIGLAMSLPFSIGGIFFAPLVLRLFIADPTVIAIGADYLRILSISFIITAVSFSYSTALRSIGHSSVPMMISLVVLTTNTVLNYCLIFGVFGFPKLGVEGAAWATAASRFIEVILFWVIVQKEHGFLHGSFSEMFAIDQKLAQRIWHTILPVVLNETLWGIGVSVYLIAYAKLGTEAVAAYQISNTVFRLFFVLNIGIANACQVMIGQQLGKEDYGTAIAYARRFVKLGVIVGVVLGALMAATGPLILPFFNVSKTVWQDVQYTLWGMGLMMAPKTVSMIYIVGILRGGGDTRYSLYLEIINVYLIGIPLSFIGVLVFHLPIYWVVLLTNVEEVTKALLGTHRLLSNKWAKNVVSDL